MAEFDQTVLRADAQALMPEEVTREIFQTVAERSSSVLSLSRRLPNMSRAQTRLPVLSLLPEAYFVSGDTGFKKTTKAAWDSIYLNAEEIAVIIPIAENVIADADYDLWGQIRPQVEVAIGGVIDRAILFGTNKPASWPDAIYDGATSAGNTVAIGTGADLYEDIMGEDGLISLLEADGYFPSGYIAQMAMRGKLRSVRASDGQLIFTNSMQGASQYMLDGEPILFPRNGSLVPGDPALMFGGAWNELVYAFREDLQVKLITEGVITDAAGAIIYNLPQQDMVALRFKVRLAWQMPNPLNRLNPDDDTRYPFAVLTEAVTS